VSEYRSGRGFDTADQSEDRSFGQAGQVSMKVVVALVSDVAPLATTL
jgi:hypothetical protein